MYAIVGTWVTFGSQITDEVRHEILTCPVVSRHVVA